jgi:membrane-associated protease RseP (regulator of RpoE activity)
MHFPGGMMSRTRNPSVFGWRNTATAVAFSVAFAANASAIIPQQTKGEPRSSRCSTCLVRRDSLRERQEKLLMRIDSLKHEFEHERLSEAKRERLTEELRRTILALQESMDQIHRANALAMAQQGSEEARAVLRAMPEIAIAIEGPYQTKGYLGVVFDGTSRDFWRDNERIVQFYAYPRIAFVEPSSPAEKAGIQQGDTLLAFNGSDVREREISLSRLLIPEHKLMVRVRRHGNPKDLKVIVGETPAYVSNRAFSRSPQVAVSTTPRPWPGDGPRQPGQAVATSPGVVVAPGQGLFFQDGIAGARVETISEGLGRALGVRSGVLVIRAAPGTPAFESGLRDGDVILTAAGRPVSSVRELRGVLEQASDYSGLSLVIVRDKKQKEVMLRW